VVRVGRRHLPVGGHAVRQRERGGLDGQVRSERSRIHASFERQRDEHVPDSRLPGGRSQLPDAFLRFRGGRCYLDDDERLFREPQVSRIAQRFERREAAGDVVRKPDAESEIERSIGEEDIEGSRSLHRVREDGVEAERVNSVLPREIDLTTHDVRDPEVVVAEGVGDPRLVVAKVLGQRATDLRPVRRGTVDRDDLRRRARPRALGLVRDVFAASALRAPKQLEIDVVSDRIGGPGLRRCVAPFARRRHGQVVREGPR
jgi:hypothetical protein